MSDRKSKVERASERDPMAGYDVTCGHCGEEPTVFPYPAYCPMCGEKLELEE